MDAYQEAMQRVSDSESWMKQDAAKGLSKEMLKASQEFRELTEKTYGTQKGACGECYTAATAFLDFLMKEGVVHPGDSYGVYQIEISADNKPFSGRGYAGFTHYVAKIGNVYFDWTMRQYCWMVMFPHVFTE